jgi:hypothetical protein
MAPLSTSSSVEARDLHLDLTGREHFLGLREGRRSAPAAARVPASARVELHSVRSGIAEGCQPGAWPQRGIGGVRGAEGIKGAKNVLPAGQRAGATKHLDMAADADTGLVASVNRTVVGIVPKMTTTSGHSRLLTVTRSLASKESGLVTDPLDSPSKLVMRVRFSSPAPQHHFESEPAQDLPRHDPGDAHDPRGQPCGDAPFSAP